MKLSRRKQKLQNTRSNKRKRKTNRKMSKKSKIKARGNYKSLQTNAQKIYSALALTDGSFFGDEGPTIDPTIDLSTQISILNSGEPAKVYNSNANVTLSEDRNRLIYTNLNTGQTFSCSKNDFNELLQHHISKII
jgi:hypothetical protein